MQISDHEVLKDRISVLPHTLMEVMSMDNMTALVSAFARAYHYRNNHTWVFADPIAEKMVTDEEYAAISQNMSQGISFFAPEFRGTQAISLLHLFWPGVPFANVQSKMQ